MNPAVLIAGEGFANGSTVWVNPKRFPTHDERFVLTVTASRDVTLAAPSDWALHDRTSRSLVAYIDGPPDDGTYRTWDITVAASGHCWLAAVLYIAPKDRAEAA